MLYTDVVEINDALKKWGILENKKIAAIHTIGLAIIGLNYQAWNILRKAGVPDSESTREKYLWWDDILIPCEVKLCEPVIFVFNDLSTLELMPYKGEGLFMSVNQIGADILDGTNNSSIDSAMLFYRANGMSISEITMIKTVATEYPQRRYSPARCSIEYQIYLKKTYSIPDYGFALSQDTLGTQKGYYKFWLTDGCHQKAPFGYATYDITLGEFEKSIKNVRQIPIIEGHDCSSYFWIMPVKIVNKPKHPNCYDNVDEYTEQEISIKEDDIGEFLYYFLKKYYDTNFPYEKLGIRDDDSGCFEGHLEHNIYTYETMEQILKDIEHCCVLLETDYDNPELGGIKERYHYRHFVPYESLPWDTPLEEQKRVIRENIGLAIDFYRRFVWRVRSMMANSPDYDLISFMGP